MSAHDADVFNRHRQLSFRTGVRVFAANGFICGGGPPFSVHTRKSFAQELGNFEHISSCDDVRAERVVS